MAQILRKMLSVILKSLEIYTLKKLFLSLLQGECLPYFLKAKNEEKLEQILIFPLTRFCPFWWPTIFVYGIFILTIVFWIKRKIFAKKNFILGPCDFLQIKTLPHVCARGQTCRFFLFSELNLNNKFLISSHVPVFENHKKYYISPPYCTIIAPSQCSWIHPAPAQGRATGTRCSAETTRTRRSADWLTGSTDVAPPVCITRSPATGPVHPTTWCARMASVSLRQSWTHSWPTI